MARAVVPLVNQCSPPPLVLVTGGAGFIGSHTVDRLLAEGARVVALDDFSRGCRDNLSQWAGAPCVEIVEADIANGLFAPLACVTNEHGPFDIIAHFAAQTAVTKSVENPLGDIRVNYTGTIQVLEYARCTGVKKVVFASSSAVYGNEVNLPVDEDAKTQPLSPYGINKLGCEKFLNYYAWIWGLRSTAFRFFNVYGPRQESDSPYSGVISSFLRRAGAGEPLTIYGDGEQTRDFVFVSDVARAVTDACLKNVADGAVINLGTGTETSVNALARLILDLTSAKSELRYAPRRPGDAQRSVACIRRARALLGFEPETSLDAGLRQTLRWMRGAIAGS